ncbi:hypothetical protein L207DRAFT_301686 [Hyaloscypha variabilis F]|uniref:Uncharacterized protein n=1 Tax=Hyaloscypha variabilis (strain UAMH 11265 / GT02V1 / F) TaxID=1149755 RepID=A0A2J6RYQ7_HYAVF|nr:hypothetical protein L207DRAFT_301686 [Hyaloscypha variabilis F]
MQRHVNVQEDRRNAQTFLLFLVKCFSTLHNLFFVLLSSHQESRRVTGVFGVSHVECSQKLTARLDQRKL